MDRYYEDAAIGDDCVTASVRITEDRLLAFADVSGDHSPLHVDEEFARTTIYGRRIAHGLLGLAIADGLKQQSDYRFHPGLSVNWSWDLLAPIFIDDEVHVRFRIAEKRLSKSRPGWGIVHVPTELINQHGQAVGRGVHIVLVSCRPTEASS
jgi:acyl dehydratase